ncbi:MAG: DegQ family serine endoprotease [Magnetococcales bacterium]|nr:DegQ family serine endoprotease [Magnetococcales bacterium]MBF0148775.1 DegQ family serine endoprotease [Magnetococcales bacterium]MBF0174289.1 DegQ family serine endoprotease [Magnetococcales bacterium]MBF0348976.1 DegQ family serine endoprotease [Magnetococcales bacterium]MBF0632549.1 DegQ family serine endoprotease [Magnetococcales bacterium]
MNMNQKAGSLQKWSLGLTVVMALVIFGFATTGLAQGLPELTDLVKKLKPSVVNIHATRKMDAEGGMGRNPFEGTPFEQFFKQFNEQLPRDRFESQNLGSGFVIDPEGFILTNHHVVDGSDKIMVRFPDEREFSAKVIGSDSKTDLALIRIETGEKLPVVDLGDSDTTEVGEWVLAIGNPFGLDATVTVGIISAKGRIIGSGPYDDFIQTDAAINPGNSGGPLFDMKGRVVGINTAIFSRSGGNMGIGFAIPVNLAKSVVNQLKTSGHVTRGWLGIGIQTVTPELAQALGLKEPKGALITHVMPGGPGEKAGLKTGDVILKFNGHEINRMRELPTMVAATEVSKKVTMDVLRDGKQIQMSATTGEMPPDEDAEQTRPANKADNDRLGMQVEPLNDRNRQRLGLDADQSGVVVMSLSPNGPAAEAGIQRSDVLVELNRLKVDSIASYEKALEATRNKETVLVRLIRNGDPLFIAINTRQ